MKLKIIHIKNWPIFHFEFKNRYDLTSTFVRIQEYYESPSNNHKDKFFTLDEYMDWYVKKNGTWDYFEKWDGFNITDLAFEGFFIIFGHSLRDKEKQVLEKIKRCKLWPGFFSGKPYCIIASVINNANILKHEITHAVYYLNDKYAKEVREIVNKYKLKSFKNELLLSGYNTKYFIDEINAYATSGWLNNKPTKEMKKLSKELNMIRKKYI